MTISIELEAHEIILPGEQRIQVWQGGAGDPVLFLHGFEGHPGGVPFLESLAKERHLIAPVHPGFDNSEDVHGIEDVVDLALLYRALIEARGGRPVDIVGHSLGGMIAAEVAALSPHLVRRLVVVNPFGLWLDEAPTADLFVMTPSELRKAAWAGTPESPPSGNGKPAAPDKVATIRRYRNFGAASRYLWPIPDRGLRKRARYITAPTLALLGNADGLVPTAYAKAWEQAIPGCRAEVLEGGHMLPYEQPGALAKRVDEFLRG